MPVNFATDLKDLKDYDYVPQVPLESLFKNLGYKQAKYDQGFQQAQRTADALMVKAYGQDAVRRDQIVAEVNENLKKFAGQDLSRDSNAYNQFMGYVSSVANSPELVGIQMRTSAFDKANAKKERLMADGKTVISEHNDPTISMQRYFAGAEPYNPNKRFSGDVFVDFDFNPLFKDVVTNTPEIEEMRKAPNGQQEYYKGKATSALYENYLKSIESNPGAKRELEAQFNNQFGGTDWRAIDQDESFQKADVAAENATIFRQLLAEETDPTKKAYLQDQYDKAVSHQQHWLEFGKNVDPNTSAEYAKQDWLAQQAMRFAASNTNYALKDQKTNDLFLQNNAAKNSLNNAIAEAENKLALANASVTVDDQGKPSIQYRAGDKQPGGNRSGVKVNVGATQYDYELFDQMIQDNNQSFVNSVITDKEFKVTKDGKTLVQTPLTIPVRNADGTYTIKGKFSVIDPKTNQAKVSQDSVTVSAREVRDSFLGQNTQMTKKMPTDSGGTLSKDGKKITVNKPIKTPAGVTVLKAGDVVNNYTTKAEVLADTSVAQGTWVFVEETGQYHKK